MLIILSFVFSILVGITSPFCSSMTASISSHASLHSSRREDVGLLFPLVSLWWACIECAGPVIVGGPEDSCTSSKTSRLLAKLLAAFEFALEILDLTLPIEYVLSLKLLDFDGVGLIWILSLTEACS